MSTFDPDLPTILTQLDNDAAKIQAEQYRALSRFALPGETFWRTQTEALRFRVTEALRFRVADELPNYLRPLYNLQTVLAGIPITQTGPFLELSLTLGLILSKIS